ncbi:hypothetical protein C0J52_26923 [Blattella germanica]|nr:hypothetical protein C0J52_26923 [Blattella germanica]
MLTHHAPKEPCCVNCGVHCSSFKQCSKFMEEKKIQELRVKNKLTFPETRKYPEWASYNIGIFVCTRCAGVHRGMGAHISKVKHLKLDRWEDSQLERMKEVGNINARLKYEERVPPCYRRPMEDDPQLVKFLDII